MGWESIADDALAAAQERLVGRSCQGFVVESLLWYGAVVIDTQAAIVWVLLSAADDELIPRRFAPADGDWSADPQQAKLDPQVLLWLRELQAEVRNEYTSRGWPAPPRLWVSFDSAARVQARGWHYFNE